MDLCGGEGTCLDEIGLGKADSKNKDLIEVLVNWFFFFLQHRI